MIRTAERKKFKIDVENGPFFYFQKCVFYILNIRRANVHDPHTSCDEEVWQHSSFISTRLSFTLTCLKYWERNFTLFKRSLRRYFEKHTLDKVTHQEDFLEQLRQFDGDWCQGNYLGVIVHGSCPCPWVRNCPDVNFDLPVYCSSPGRDRCSISGSQVCPVQWSECQWSREELRTTQRHWYRDRSRRSTPSSASERRCCLHSSTCRGRYNKSLTPCIQLPNPLSSIFSVDHWQVRYKIFYHLACLFPVLELKFDS